MRKRLLAAAALMLSACGLVDNSITQNKWTGVKNEYVATLSTDTQTGRSYVVTYYCNEPVIGILHNVAPGSIDESPVS